MHRDSAGEQNRSPALSAKMHLIAQKRILSSGLLQSRRGAGTIQPILRKGVEQARMKVILHDLDPSWDDRIRARCDRAIAADGKYAPCQGCFGCWTRHPAECYIKDRLQQVCRVIGRADELVIVTRNLYGGYSAAVKNVLDRSIGTSTPFSTYRGRQMHHTLRYGKHALWKVIVYGEITEAEKASFRELAERNAVNDGYARAEVLFVRDLAEGEGSL